MRRASLLALVAVIAGVVSVVGSPPPAQAALGPGPFPKSTHPGVGATGPRDYFTYESSTTAGGARPLVVFLHGCNQNAKDAAIGTRWTELAEKRDFVVVFPEQPVTANGINCWNWFEPAHQSRGVGEPAVLAGITRDAIAATGADPSRVYVMGISAGADMAMILGATYPDLYAAMSGFAGCAYATCADVTGVLAHRAMGPQARVLPVFLAQGTIDPLNNFAMGETMARQWIGTNDLADDGAANQSISPVPTKVEHIGFDASALAGVGKVGDPCVRGRQYPCAGALVGAKSYPYSIEHHADRKGCDVVDFWIVQGLSHDYPAGDPAGTFTDPIGPDITTAGYEFFLRHTLGSPCGGVRVAASAPGAATETSPSNGGGSAPAPAPGTQSGSDARPRPSGVLPVTGPSADGPVTLAFGLLLSACGCRLLLRARKWRPLPLDEASGSG